jgi:hypothetical protein
VPNPIFNRMPRMFMARFKEKDKALYSESGAEPREVDVIFNARYALVLVGNDGLSAQSIEPVAWLKADDVPNLRSGASGDTLLINGTTYKVSTNEPDGYGMIMARLKKVAS